MSAYKETFFPMPMPRKDAPLQLLLAGITHPDPAYRIVRHSPTDLYVLEYVIRGKGHLYWGDKYYRPSGGDVYLLQPPLSHAYHSDAADPWEKIWFNLSGPLIGALCDAYRLRGIVYFHDCRLEKEFFEAAELLRKRPQAASGKQSHGKQAEERPADPRAPESSGRRPPGPVCESSLVHLQVCLTVMGSTSDTFSLVGPKYESTPVSKGSLYSTE